MAASAAEPADRAVRGQVLTAASAVRARPAAEAPVVEPLPPGARVDVLGEFSGYLWVRAPGGSSGWITAPAEPRADQ